MPDEPTDVAPDSSSGTPPSSTAGTETPPVSTGDQAPEDRPVQNVLAEFNRKYARLERQLSDVMTYLSSMGQPTATPQPSPPSSPKDYSDDELWTMAQQGNRAAFEMFMERIAERKTGQVTSQQREEGLVHAQLQALYAKYRVLSDPSHPLTQHAMTVKTLLLSQGRANTRATDLDAIKTAIADRPDLVAALMGQPAQAREDTRHASATSAQAVEGAAHRQRSAAPAKLPLTPQDMALASRMGIKDPAKAKERFLKRQDEKRSALSPVAMTIAREEG